MAVRRSRGEALTEAVGLAAELEQMTAAREAVQQRRDQAGAVEDAGPVRKLEVGGDGERTSRVAMDDIGTLPAGQEAAEAFYHLVDPAYEKRSLAVTSNLHPAGFDTIMPKALATPAVDRLLHHAHLILTEVSSRRLAEAPPERV